jgi:hypothetical protein
VPASSNVQTADGSYLLFASGAFTVDTAGMYNITG